MNNNYLLANKNDFLKELNSLIKIKSFLTENSNYPTNEQKQALEYLSDLGKSQGMKTFVEKDGHYGYLEIGEGKELIGILSHVDVVPPGDLSKWSSNPFELTVKKIDNQELLIGRGIADDKGPTMLAFYLLKKLQQNKLTKRIRLIVGTDEEVLWRGIAKYKSEQELPKFGFTPDGDFPLIYAEKPLYQWKGTYSFEKEHQNFKLWGGSAANIIPSEAFYQGPDLKKLAKLLKANNVNYHVLKDEIIKVNGKASHSKEPQDGKNAILILTKYLGKIINHPFINYLNKGFENNGTGLKMFNERFSDDIVGYLTMSINKINFNENEFEFIVDMRLPLDLNLDELKIIIQNFADKYQIDTKGFDYLPGVLSKPNSQINKIYSNAYQEITNDKTKPYSTGGASYARSMENIVCFGPIFKNWKSNIHDINENMSFDNFVTAFSIYEKAMNELLKI